MCVCVCVCVCVCERCSSPLTSNTLVLFGSSPRGGVASLSDDSHTSSTISCSGSAVPLSIGYVPQLPVCACVHVCVCVCVCCRIPYLSCDLSVVIATRILIGSIFESGSLNLERSSDGTLDEGHCDTPPKGGYITHPRGAGLCWVRLKGCTNTVSVSQALVGMANTSLNTV